MQRAGGLGRLDAELVDEAAAQRPVDGERVGLPTVGVEGVHEQSGQGLAAGVALGEIAVDDDGLDVNAVERELEGPSAAFLYTIPTFQNPSGRTLGEERRRRIVELAREHDLLVLEDDPYGLVRFEGDPLPSLLELSGGDRKSVV